MQKITTFLTYDHQAEQAAKFYVSVFKHAKLLDVTRFPEGMAEVGGNVLTATFEIDGQQFVALNGGPTFNFCEGMSLYVNCQDQAEVDDLWDKLTASGGEPGRCGWLKDKFGVSWQIIPSGMSEMLNDPDAARAGLAMQAMMTMNKIDLAAMQRAADQA
jgi:predicted 3-demethylubiquinone-9 3-methyltransferase (glyoxalase superfamily)